MCFMECVIVRMVFAGAAGDMSEGPLSLGAAWLLDRQRPHHPAASPASHGTCLSSPRRPLLDTLPSSHGTCLTCFFFSLPYYLPLESYTPVTHVPHLSPASPASCASCLSCILCISCFSKPLSPCVY